MLADGVAGSVEPVGVAQGLGPGVTEFMGPLHPDARSPAVLTAQNLALVPQSQDRLQGLHAARLIAKGPERRSRLDIGVKVRVQHIHPAVADPACRSGNPVHTRRQRTEHRGTVPLPEHQAGVDRSPATGIEAQVAVAEDAVDEHVGRGPPAAVGHRHAAVRLHPRALAADVGVLLAEADTDPQVEVVGQAHVNADADPRGADRHLRRLRRGVAFAQADRASGPDTGPRVGLAIGTGLRYGVQTVACEFARGRDPGAIAPEHPVQLVPVLAVTAAIIKARALARLAR